MSEHAAVSWSSACLCVPPHAPRHRRKNGGCPLPGGLRESRRHVSRLLDNAYAACRSRARSAERGLASLCFAAASATVLRALVALSNIQLHRSRGRQLQAGAPQPAAVPATQALRCRRRGAGEPRPHRSNLRPSFIRQCVGQRRLIAAARAAAGPGAARANAALPRERTGKEAGGNAAASCAYQCQWSLFDRRRVEDR